MKINAVHQEAIVLIASGLNNKRVAKQLDIAQETVSRWKSDYNFRALLNQQLNSNHQFNQNKLRSLTSTALSTIEQVMTDEDAPHRDRMTAALKIIELTKLKQGNIGATSPAALKRQEEQDALLDSYGF